MKQLINSVLTSSALLLSASFPQAIAADNVPYTSQPIVIDGQASESVWQQASWRSLKHHIVGEIPTAEDFSGQYKLLWDENYLYLLAEIQDDVLFDAHANPLEKYWDDDCLEIFIDEDHSGGNHQFNFNAFAYHIALDNQAVDIGFEDAPNGPFLLLNQHINSQWKRQSTPPYKVIWEVAIEVHNDRFVPNSKMRTRVPLNEGKTLGFMLAYCDNDGSETREHFMGSHKITPVNGDKNLGYITADVFGDIKLIKSKK